MLEGVEGTFHDVAALIGAVAYDDHGPAATPLSGTPLTLANARALRGRALPRATTAIGGSRSCAAGTPDAPDSEPRASLLRR
ncbi:hypothetical protein GCM10023113_15570 [Cellulomonas oligotrophica]|uniref:Uncharacterized protein n=1 Tax=Cellulomonas oligotrophica TaxID=931536 RepID=A0ABQ4D7F8_9CELL|nr:hypothetical protein Col01nite_08140 [Cellulomonas oligotrophica]